VVLVDGGVRPNRARRRRQRHVLVIGLVGGGTDFQELPGIARRVGAVIGVVVRHLMVVPDRQPRKDGVGGLQVRVGFVQCVAIAKLGKRRRNSDAVLADVARAPGFFVDIV